MSSDVPTVRHLIGDAIGYVEWSRRIAAGAWVGDRGFYQAPLYPYTLAVWRMFGCDSVAAIRAMQAICGALGCVLMYVAVSRWTHARIGLIAGLMLAVYGPAIYFDGIIQKASLDCLLVCVMLAMAAGVVRRASLFRCAMLGAVVSLLCLTRENAMAWHFVLPVWIFLRGRAQDREESSGSPTRSGNWKAAGAYLLGAAVTLAPVGVRNYYVQGQLSLTTFQAGPNFYIGNSREADGRYRPLVRGHETPAFEQSDATRLAEQALGRSLTPREVSDYWMQRAADDIRAEPARWLRLLAYKVLLTWNRYEIADAESIAVYRRHSPVLDGLCRVWDFGILAPLAVFGALTIRGRVRFGVLHILLPVMTIAVAAFYVLARYRYPLAPLLIPLAAIGLERLLLSARRAEIARPEGASATESRRWWPVVAALGTAVVVNWPIQDERRLDALADMNAGVALAQAGELTEASEYFARTVASHPTSVEANYNLALSLAMRERYAEAIPVFERALSLSPGLIGGHYNLAVALERTGRIAEAIGHYELAVQDDPADQEARAAIARLRSTDGQP